MIYRAKTGAGSLTPGFFVYLVVLLNGLENSLLKKQLKTLSIDILYLVDSQ